MTRKELKELAEKVIDEETARLAVEKQSKGMRRLRFHKRDQRKLRKTVSSRLRAEADCGFITLEWFLLVALGSLIRLAILRIAERNG